MIDLIVLSPPYAGSSGGHKKSVGMINSVHKGLFERCGGGMKGMLSSDVNNIDNLPYGEAE